MPAIGVTELLFVLLLALLLFGPRKLPELGRSLGRGLAEFRRASNELRTTIENEMQSLEREGSTPAAPDEPAKTIQP
ncbi:MAG: twin-arginine translocase TatA/TatE family subunit [Acidobacteria bacterium]|nr:twin-arginine translocase TatA/TatE family subunit [Acidobacteriota bacterium]